MSAAEDLPLVSTLALATECGERTSTRSRLGVRPWRLASNAWPSNRVVGGVMPSLKAVAVGDINIHVDELAPGVHGRVDGKDPLTAVLCRRVLVASGGIPAGHDYSASLPATCRRPHNRRVSHCGRSSEIGRVLFVGCSTGKRSKEQPPLPFLVAHNVGEGSYQPCANSAARTRAVMRWRGRMQNAGEK